MFLSRYLLQKFWLGYVYTGGSFFCIFVLGFCSWLDLNKLYGYDSFSVLFPSGCGGLVRVGLRLGLVRVGMVWVGLGLGLVWVWLRLRLIVSLWCMDGLSGGVWEMDK